MEGWGARAHSPGLVIAHVCSCMLAVIHGQSSHARSSSFICILSSFVCIHFHLWACVIVCGHSFLLVRMRPHLWVFVFVHGHSFFMDGQLCSCVCILVLWCTVGRLVDPCGHSWCSCVVAGGVLFVVVGHVTWALLLMLEKEVGAWGYETHLHAQ